MRRGTSKLQFRDSSAFDPTQLSGLVLWLDAADFSTFTLDGSNNVQQWNDKSGNGRNAAQSTALNRPSYLSNQLNGYGAVKGNGSSQWLEVASFPSLANGYTIYAVSQSSGATSSAFLSINAGVIGGAISVGNDPGSGGLSFISQWGDALTQPAPAAGVDFTRMIKYDGSHNTGNFRLRLSTQTADSTKSMTQNPGTPPAGTMSVLRASTTYSASNVYEIIIFSRQTTTDEDALLKSYITAKWGLTWS